GVAILLATALLVVGAWVAGRLGLLPSDASDGYVIGIALAAALILLTSVGAAILSAGRSGFAPIAIGMGAGLVLVRSPAGSGEPGTRRGLVPVGARSVLLAGAFLVVFGLVYAATMTPSPRDGVQPVEFMDEAFYSILGRDLVRTGAETWIT